MNILTLARLYKVLIADSIKLCVSALDHVLMIKFGSYVDLQSSNKKYFNIVTLE